VFSVDVGFSYYDLATLFHGPTGDLYVTYVTFTATHGEFKPTLQLEAYRSGRGSDFEGGYRAKLGLEYSHAFANGATFTYMPSIVKDDGTFGNRPAWVTSHEASLSWKISKSGAWTLKCPTVLAFVPLTIHSGRGTNVIYGFGVSTGSN
jgi:hypothetical protein